jgi:SRSO17 transposase
MFATKPEQAIAMVRDALQLGLNASWFAGDEVYSGRRHRRSYRELGRCYAVAVKTDHVITCGFGKRWEARHAINKVRPEQWQRMHTGHGSKGTREYDWAWNDVRADDTPDGHEDGQSVLVAVLDDRDRRPCPHSR